MDGWWERRTGVTKVSVGTIAVLALITLILLYMTAHHAVGTTRTGKTVWFGWDNAVSVFMLSTKPFDTHVGLPATLLAICGFVFVPAMTGAVAGLVLGEIVAGEKGHIQAYVREVAQQWADDAFAEAAPVASQSPGVQGVAAGPAGVEASGHDDPKTEQ
jgi:hypothetical protein